MCARLSAHYLPATHSSGFDVRTMPNFSLAKIGVPLPDTPWAMALYDRDSAGLRLEEVRFQSTRGKAISCLFRQADWTRKAVGLKACAVGLLHCAASVEAASVHGRREEPLEVAASSSSANWLSALLTFYEEGVKAIRQGTPHPASRLLDLRERTAVQAKHSGLAEFMHVERHPRADDARKLSLHFGTSGCVAPRITIFIGSNGGEPRAERDEASLRELAARLVADTPRWTAEVHLAGAAKAHDPDPVPSHPAHWAAELYEDPAWRKVLAFQAQQLYAEAAKLADREWGAPHNAQLPVRRGLWAGKAAAAYRAQGRLARAAERGEEALRELERAVGDGAINAVEGRFLKSKAAFGLIIVREVMMKSDFAAALAQQTELLVEADELLVLPLPASQRLLLDEHRFNILRQRHECRRYLGRYEEALASASALERQYAKGSAGQTFCRIHQADNLRLLGRFDEARSILETMLKRTRDFSGDGPQASLLWRLATMQLAEGSPEAKATLAELSRFTETDERQNRWLSVYGELVLASAATDAPDQCLRRLSQAKKCGHSSATYRPLEYAYAELIRGELARAQGPPRAGRSAFAAALALFKKMRMPWGRLRAAIGLRLCGGHGPLSFADSAHSPLYRALMDAVAKPDSILPGALAWNLP